MPEPPFYAIDGEACEGDYVLLNRSGSHPLTDLRPGGLHTIACLEYLLQAPPKALQVCFGLGYDVNQWLRDLPRSTLEKLWHTNICYWRDYRIEWIPRYAFSVKAIDGRYARVTEIWGFFQSSFVKALESWEIASPAEIKRMKARRGEFRRSEIAEVTRYCQAECLHTVELMNRVRGACREAGITPEKWAGAGSIAAALLNREGVKGHHRYDRDLGSKHVAEEIIRGAYFGGRVELLRQGVYHRVESADLKSAYPAAAAQLPSLCRARLRKVKRFNPDRPGIWRVSWDLRRECEGGEAPARGLAPFPVRHKQSIYYPLAGAGHYHGVEVAAALKLGYPIKVHWGYVLQGPAIEERPFEFIPRVFSERLRFVREGRAAEKMVKLALNSVYGKLAQGVSWQGELPKFQSYFWAGAITAATRAKILLLAARCRDPIMIATDGIYAAEIPRRGLGRGRGLGSWERGEAEELFAAQAGVYEATSGGRTVAKSRGFYAAEVDYRELREGWEAEGIDYVHHYSSRRFMGLGGSLMRSDFSIWRQWVTEPRSILLLPERKLAGPEGRLDPPPIFLESEPYVSKERAVDPRSLAQTDGVDQPQISAEYEDRQDLERL